MNVYGNNNSYTPNCQGDWIYTLEEHYGRFILSTFDRIEASQKLYCTFTFHRPIHPESAYKAFNIAIHRWNREAYGVRYWKRRHGAVGFVALEYQKRDVIHFHSLVAFPVYPDRIPREVRRMDMVDWWWNKFGIARIYDYDPSLGASYYLGKYVSKGGEIDWFGRTDILKPQLRLF